MKLRGGTRGVVSAWFGLIVLQTVVSQGGSGKIAGAFDAVNYAVQRVFDPNVPAIPDRSGGRSSVPKPPKDSTKAPRPAAPAPPPATAKEKDKALYLAQPPR